MSIRLYAILVVILICKCLSAQSLAELRNAADYGSGSRQSTAEHLLGYKYMLGEGEVPKDPVKGFSWLKRSANHGSATGAYGVGTCYRYGVGVAKNINEAVKWFEIAAERYDNAESGANMYSALELAKMYIWGDEISENLYKGIKYAKMAAFRGSPEGKYLYALCFSNGYGTQSDSVRAKIWAYRALDDKYYTAYWLLGNMYLYGTCVDESEDKAIDCYKRGDEKNEFNCQYSLGKIYENHYAGLDLFMALEYYEKAANNGHSQAIVRLGILYSDKDSEYYDIDKSIYWLEKTIEGGNYSACRLLMENYYVTSNTYKANNLYSMMMEKANSSNLNNLAYFYVKHNEIPSNFVKAHAVIDRAIELSPTDYNYLDSKGEFYLIEGDEKKAFKIWKTILKNNPHYYDNPENLIGKSILNEHFSKQN